MRYPSEMTADDIMQFEYEYNRLRDIEDNLGQYWEINAECQIVAELPQIDSTVA